MDTPGNNTVPKAISMPTFNQYSNNPEPKVVINADDFNMFTPSASPYSRRIPMSERIDIRRDNNLRKAHSIDWTPSSSDCDDPSDIKIQLQELPITLKKPPSMMNLRQKRDPNFFGNRKPRPARVMSKGGQRNIEALNLPQKSKRFFLDMATTIIEEQWRMVILFFTLAFFLSWAFFAVLWYVIALAHGDLNFDENGVRLGDGQMPCVQGATTFTGFFLLSVETQVSTGYGERYPTEECPEGVFLLIAQLTIGIIIDGAIIGIVYAKMIRPPKYADFKFSKRAVVCQRDGKLCLIIRVCDFKQTQGIDSKVKAFFFEERKTKEGENLGKCQTRLKLENNGRVFLIWPVTVCHVIDENSPLYDMSAKEFLEKRFEIIVSLTGISRTTGQTTQARSSYMPREIMWGHRFRNIITYDHVSESYIAHIEKLDDVEEIETPLCSSKRYNEVAEELEHYMDPENKFHLDEIFESDEEEGDLEEYGLHMKEVSTQA